MKPELIMTNPRVGRSVRILVSAACLTLVLASCGDGGDDTEVSIPVPAESGSRPTLLHLPRKTHRA